MNAVVTLEKTDTPPETLASDPISVLLTLVQSNPSIEVAKLEKLIELAERLNQRKAFSSFNSAVAGAKAEIQPITKTKLVDYQNNRGGRTKFRHEGLDDIAEHVAPILSKHGLSYRFNSSQDGKKLSVTCILAHRDGHHESVHLSCDNDESGGKNSVQAVGSAATYLQRYTVKLALGLAAADDDDGQASGMPALPAMPAGYHEWQADMTAVADEGTQRLQDTWKSSSQEFRRYATQYEPNWWIDVKRVAVNADAAYNKNHKEPSSED